MKLQFNFKNKEASLEADVEKLIDKKMEYKQQNGIYKEPRKTRYQIRQEEKRKRLELEHKQNMQMLIGLGIFIIIMIIIFIVMSYLGIE